MLWCNFSKGTGARLSHGESIYTYEKGSNNNNEQCKETDEASQDFLKKLVRFDCFLGLGAFFFFAVLFSVFFWAPFASVGFTCTSSFTFSTTRFVTENSSKKVTKKKVPNVVSTHLNGDLLAKWAEWLQTLFLRKLQRKNAWKDRIDKIAKKC